MQDLQKGTMRYFINIFPVGFCSHSILLFSMMALSGCKAIPLERPEFIDIPVSFTESGSAEVESSWWLAFEDEQLNHLIREALTNNLTIRGAEARLREAYASARSEAGNQYPSLSAFFAGRDEDAETSGNQELELGLSASYEIDLWGGVQAAADAEGFRAIAESQAYQTAIISLSAEIANTWFGLLEAHSRRNLLMEQVEANENALHLLERRFAGGQTRSVDVLRQRQLVAATLQVLHQAEGDLGVLEYRLAVLTGRTPGTLPPYKATPLPELPPQPSTGLPMDLVRRRPDVRAAFRPP